MVTLVVTDPDSGERYEFTGATQQEAEANADAFFNAGVTDSGAFVGDDERP